MNATFAPRFRLGNYELLVELASGGMATVGVALQHGAAGFQRLVVVKRVHRHLLKNKDFSDMFRDEARLASSIRHANVVPVVDVIENEGELCLVMEYFESLALSTMIDAAKATSRLIAPAVASRILGDTLAGLHAAHEAVDMRRQKLGIVHRDVSPQNVIVDVGGVSRVIDFGVAKAASRLTQTKSGYVKGKFGYMSPEQIEALPIDRRTDLFAAGVVLHETLTGNRLFDGQDEFEIMRRVLRGEVPDASKVAVGLTPEVDLVLRKALARDAGNRFQTALEFQTALYEAIPPAPAADVASALFALCGTELEERHQKLLAMLGDELEKLSPRSTPKNLGMTTLRDEALPGKTLLDPTIPAMMTAPLIRTLPLIATPAKETGASTLRSEPSASNKVAGPVTSPETMSMANDADAALPSAHDVAGLPARMSTAKIVALSAVASAVVAGIALVALRGPAEPAPSPAPVASQTPSEVPALSASSSAAPTTVASLDASVAPLVPSQAAAPPVPSPPSKPGGGKSKPADKLQPSPY